MDQHKRANEGPQADRPTLTFVYTNYKGETAVRHTYGGIVRWGQTPHHPEPQWLFEAFDRDKGDYRAFAVKDMAFGEEANALRNKIEELTEENANVRSVMKAFFELGKKTEEMVTPILMDGLEGYIRRAKNGGMPTKRADDAMNVLADFCRIYVGNALLPVLRTIQDNRIAALEEAVKLRDEQLSALAAKLPKDEVTG